MSDQPATFEIWLQADEDDFTSVVLVTTVDEVREAEWRVKTLREQGFKVWSIARWPQ